MKTSLRGHENSRVSAAPNGFIMLYPLNDLNSFGPPAKRAQTSTWTTAGAGTAPRRSSPPWRARAPRAPHSLRRRVGGPPTPSPPRNRPASAPPTVVDSISHLVTSTIWLIWLAYSELLVLNGLLWLIWLALLAARGLEVADAQGAGPAEDHQHLLLLRRALLKQDRAGREALPLAGLPRPPKS